MYLISNMLTHSTLFLPEMIWTIVGSICATFGISLVVVKVYYPWLILDFRYIAKMLPPMIRFLSNMNKKRFLIDIFEERVKQTPDKVFIIFEDKKYTYKVSRYKRLV